MSLSSGVFARGGLMAAEMNEHIRRKSGGEKSVGHAQWVFTIPKMLRPYFLYHRELLGELCRAAYLTLRELRVAAVDDKEFRPGMVAVIQTFSDSLRWNPHVQAMVSRGGWTAGGEWVRLAYVDSHAAELLFRAQVFQLLQRRGLLTDERIRLGRFRDLLPAFAEGGVSGSWEDEVLLSRDDAIVHARPVLAVRDLEIEPASVPRSAGVL